MQQTCQSCTLLPLSHQGSCPYVILLYYYLANGSQCTDLLSPFSAAVTVTEIHLVGEKD